MIEKTDPRVWNVKKHGLPTWFTRPIHIIRPFYTPHAIAEAQHQSIPLPDKLDLAALHMIEIKVRENPWHHAGRVERMTLADTRGVQFTLKLSGPDEQVQCLSVLLPVSKPAVTETRRSGGRYKGPRQTNDTRSAVSGKVPNRP